MQPDISIIVPVYNKVPYLAECLESLRAQTHENIEIMTVDDGSTDASPAICRRFCEADPRFRFVRQPNGGQNAARKTGVERAQGKWVMFVDADDTVTPDICAHLLQRQRETDADMVCAMLRKVPGGIVDMTYPQVISGRDVLHALVPWTFGDGKRFHYGLLPILFRMQLVRDAFQTLDLRMTYGEDVACTFAILTHAERVAFLQEVVYFWRMQDASFCHTHTGSNVLTQKWMLSYVAKVFQAQRIPAEDLQGAAWLAIRDLLLGGYEFFADFDGLYPFFKGVHGRRIAVYGAGVFGGEIVAKLSKEFELAGWYDREYQAFRKNGRDVQSPESISEGAFDHLVIAILDPHTAARVAEGLRAKLPPRCRIHTISDSILAAAYTRQKLEELRNLDESDCDVSPAVPPRAGE